MNGIYELQFYLGMCTIIISWQPNAAGLKVPLRLGDIRQFPTFHYLYYDTILKLHHTVYNCNKKCSQRKMLLLSKTLQSHLIGFFTSCPSRSVKLIMYTIEKSSLGLCDSTLMSAWKSKSLMFDLKRHPTPTNPDPPSHGLIQTLPIIE